MSNIKIAEIWENNAEIWQLIAEFWQLIDFSQFAEIWENVAELWCLLFSHFCRQNLLASEHDSQNKKNWEICLGIFLEFFL
jgi:hypothetical protein